MGGRDRRIWRGKTLDQLSEDELEELAAELTAELPEGDPMIQEVRDRLRAYRRRQDDEAPLGPLRGVRVLPSR